MPGGCVRYTSSARRRQPVSSNAIRLAEIRPLLLRPVLQNADENVRDDHLRLTPLLRGKLRERSYPGGRGGGKALVQGQRTAWATPQEGGLVLRGARGGQRVYAWRRGEAAAVTS